MSEHALLYVQKGAQIVHQGNRSFMIGQGEAMFLRSNNYSITEMALSSQHYQCIMLFFQESFIKDFVVRQNIHSSPIETCPEIFKLAPDDRAKLLIENILFDKTNEPTDRKAQFSHNVIELLSELLQEDKNNKFTSFLNSLCFRPKLDLKPFMEDRSYTRIPIEALAKLSGRSLRSFERDFEEAFDESPSSWVNRKRLEQAYFLLTHTPDSIAEIGNTVGFSSTSGFIEAFQKAYDMTPQEVSEKAGK
ncbi:MAG: helix-turn-helix domain-containing protein [Calditrichia bacterium]